MTEEQKHAAGLKIIAELHLMKLTDSQGNSQYMTAQGPKDPASIYTIVRSLVAEVQG